MTWARSGRIEPCMTFENVHEGSPKQERKEAPAERPESEAAQERRLKAAEELGNELASFDARSNELVGRINKLSDKERVAMISAACAEQNALLAKYPPNPGQGLDERKVLLKKGREEMPLAFDEEALKRDRAELTARRIERAAFTAGSSVAALAEAPRAAVEKAVTPFLETSRGALKQATAAAAETLDKISPSVIKAAEEAVLKIGSSAAQVGGKAFLLAAEGLGKLVEKVGLGSWTVVEKIIEKAPAAAGRGIKAFVMAFAKKE